MSAEKCLATLFLADFEKILGGDLGNGSKLTDLFGRMLAVPLSTEYNP
jgi:hypothetical protein